MGVDTRDPRAALAAVSAAIDAGSVAEEDALRLLGAAEARIASGEAAGTESDFWHDYLDRTRRSPFLRALPGREARERWAETALAAVLLSDYRLETLMEQRLRAHPGRVLFQEGIGPEARRWTYAQGARRIRSYAAVLWKESEGAPRVAILAENGAEGAFVDLACLMHDILVTPLDPKMNAETIAWILDHLDIDTVVTDTEERRRRLETVRAGVKRPFRVYLLDPDARVREEHEKVLARAAANLGRGEVEERLGARRRLGLRDPITVMFTSGSTGMPKGVVFTSLAIVSKRFARAAALPAVGEEEVLFCYLPLFHTFGRYLEMTGTLFWGGTYVFAGNPSVETLLAGLREVRPTGLIGIPRRWMQIRDHVLASAGGDAVTDGHFRAVSGGRLRWGLSAAGYLDPRVFRFFQRHGVDLCSGFGMTEATGGITMTPPGEYEDNTVGIPLPLVRTRITEEGELRISGPYVVRYLDDDAPDGEDGYWLATGDIFQTRPSGYLEIVDRIKDIYKNSRGQTVAPRRVEQKFAEVPGIKNVFLVGDGRDYNSLLIVPDLDDSVMVALSDREQSDEYFQRIITTANEDLDPYERVVNFALLDRDFSAEKGELTPKGSFRRKGIEKNFEEEIERLYGREFVELETAGRWVRVPRWFYRDLGILETDLVATSRGLVNRVSRTSLDLAPGADPLTVRIGDLEYRVDGEVVDLGLFARQPALWIGNPALLAFFPCKEGWDTAMKNVSPEVHLPWRKAGAHRADPAGGIPPLGGRRLEELNRFSAVALWGPPEDAFEAVKRLGEILENTDLRMGMVIRRRLEALARHPEMEVRALAYRVLLLDQPVPDYGELFPAFVVSGLPFLNKESIAAIARANLDRRRLEALRLRFHSYRTQLEWPTSPVVRQQFEHTFALLTEFARFHPEYYSSIRAELVSWVLHRADPELSQAAELEFERLAHWFELRLAGEAAGVSSDDWKGKTVLEDGLSDSEIRHLENVLVGTTFLRESVALAFDGESFDVRRVPQGGIWISRVLSLHEHQLYRISINTVEEKHYDLLLMLRPDLEKASVHETNFWLIAIHGHPVDTPVVPRFGCCRPELGAISFAFVSDLTVWERVRGEAEAGDVGGRCDRWRSLFVRGMAVFFRGWQNSGGRIVPGAVTPRNVSVPDPDFRDGAKLLSLAGWKRYRSPIDLVAPMIRNFFLQIEHHYPRCRKEMDWSWIFEACVEGLGEEEAREFLNDLRGVIGEGGIPGDADRFARSLDAYLGRLGVDYHVPLPVRCAVDRYRSWEELSRDATTAAKDQMVRELVRLYRIERFGALGRYWLYRRTLFSGSTPAVQDALDRLLARMMRNPAERPTRMVELSDVQAALEGEEERMVFTGLVFPSAPSEAPVDVVAVGERSEKHVVVHTYFDDERGERYTVREPLEAAEVGELIRLIIRGGFPNIVSEQDRYFVAIDAQERIVGGIFYKIMETGAAHLDGIVVSSPLKRRGISGALLEDFCSRMEGQGVKTVTTHFFARHFYLAHGFHVDRAWGGLVRFLHLPEEEPV